MELHQRRLVGHPDDAVDGAAGQRGERDGAILAAADGGHGEFGTLLGHDIEGVGRPGEADAAAGLERIEWQFYEQRRIAIQHPKRIAVWGKAHTGGDISRVRFARDGERSGVDFVNGAVLRREDEDFAAMGMGEDEFGRGVKGDAALHAEALQTDNRHGATALGRDEAVAGHARRFFPAAAEACRGSEQQEAPGDEGTGHCLILLRCPKTALA